MAYLGRVKPTETTSSVLRSTYTGNGSTTTYALPGPVANETSIIATINGVTQQDAAYSTDGTNIIFAAAPALGDAIELRTLSAVAMSYAPSAGSVVTGTIADLGVTTAKINDLAVTTGKVNDLAITGGKIAAATITQDKLSTNVVGNGPAFFAFRSADQSITQSSYTRINFDSESYDTNSNYDNATNYRFTPTVAGYYLLFASLLNNPAGSGQYVTAIRKNGGNLFPNGNLVNTGVGGGSSVPTTNLVYANGTTDYFDVVAYASTASPTVQGGSTFFGYMVRAA